VFGTLKLDSRIILRDRQSQFPIGRGCWPTEMLRISAAQMPRGIERWLRSAM
jgi:hypothetical protein